MSYRQKNKIGSRFILILGLMILSLALTGVPAASGADAPKTGNVTIKWYGQACFLITTSTGVKIITDPISFGQYKVPQDVEPDIVTVSHEHMDHNKVDKVTGQPVVIRGLAEGAKDFAKIDREIKGIRIYTVPSYHDAQRGAERGLNAIFVFEFDGLRLVHLGDLGHVLSADQADKIGQADIVMIPVGGRYTIWGAEAHEVISQIRPRMLVFPMHYRTEAAKFLPYTAEEFTAGKEGVNKITGNAYTLALSKLPDKMGYILMDYK